MKLKWIFLSAITIGILANLPEKQRTIPIDEKTIQPTEAIAEPRQTTETPDAVIDKIVAKANTNHAEIRHPASQVGPKQNAVIQIVKPESIKVDTTKRGYKKGVTFTLDTKLIPELRAQEKVVLKDFPIEDNVKADLDLHRFNIFKPTTKIVVMTNKGPKRLPHPDVTFFKGYVANDLTSHVFVSVTSKGMSGFVGYSKKGTYRFAPENEAGDEAQMMVYSNRDVDTAVFPEAPTPLDDAVESKIIASQDQQVMSAQALSSSKKDKLLEVEIALDTDNELLENFKGNTSKASTYIASLIAADSSIYERDAKVRLVIENLRFWTKKDPWPDNINGILIDFGKYWYPDFAYESDIVFLLMGRGSSGVANLSGLCQPFSKYGVGSMLGSSDLRNPYFTQDILLSSHEIGHLLGSPHTHCYSPPLDRCANHECYNGPIVPENGTIMSYCHQHVGVANVKYEFPPQVVKKFRYLTENTKCTSVAGETPPRPTTCTNKPSLVDYYRLGAGSLEPGASTVYRFRISNVDSPLCEGDTFTFSAELPDGWIYSGPTRIQYSPREGGFLDVNVRSANSAKLGPNPLRFAVTRDKIPTLSWSETHQLTVAGEGPVPSEDDGQIDLYISTDKSEYALREKVIVKVRGYYHADQSPASDRKVEMILISPTNDAKKKKTFRLDEDGQGSFKFKIPKKMSPGSYSLQSQVQDKESGEVLGQASVQFIVK